MLVAVQLGLDNWSPFSNRQSARHGAEPIVVIKVYAEDWVTERCNKGNTLIQFTTITQMHTNWLQR